MLEWSGVLGDAVVVVGKEGWGRWGMGCFGGSAVAMPFGEVEVCVCWEYWPLKTALEVEMKGGLRKIHPWQGWT